MTNPSDDPLVQYILIRRDLQQELGWSVGSLIAQGAHAAIAALADAMGEESVQQYLSIARQQDPDGPQMHKVVLEVKNIEMLLKFSDKLKEAQILHHVWNECPEMTPTCLCTIPYLRSKLKPLFKGLPLFR